MGANEHGESGLDRRALIKRAGIVSAGVAAWSTPMVTSLASKAYAVGSAAVSCEGCTLGNDTCGTQPQCGDGGPQNFCHCSQTVAKDRCTCVEAGFCNQFQVCATQADCPAGTICTLTCCSEPLCLFPCDSPFQQRRAPLPDGVGEKTAAF